jgi:hypothetical protein
MKFILSCILIVITTVAFAQSKDDLVMSNQQIKLNWHHTPSGWKLKTVAVRNGSSWTQLDKPSGEHIILYSKEKPGNQPDTVFKTITDVSFPEPNYKYQQEQWKESTSPVSLNTAGKLYNFFPEVGKQTGKNAIQFVHEIAPGVITTEWSFDSLFPSDIIVKQTLQVKQVGYFSISTPSLATVAESNLDWATVPGYFQGNTIQKNFVLAYAYGHGVPDLPVIYRERCASTLSPIISTKNGISFSAIPEPGLARDPWEKDKITQEQWSLGLSHKNRKSELTPTLYYPVLGEEKSYLKEGEQISYQFRYSLTMGDWFKVLNHAVYNIYRFKDALALRQTKQSLTSRIEQMHLYLTDPATSMWNVEEFQNLKIGAQSYLGGVVGSNKDAMKNSDYGAMWYLASVTKDSRLTEDRLPYALNFKLAQQQTENGFFKGAAVGQYYLGKSKKFVEEWGEVVEPIGLTYYTMLDVGNILLFEPGNEALKERLKLGAETLYTWQKDDGSWAVAYDRKSQQQIFNDIKDLRPTFYGMIVAYRILKDQKYLAAAKKGADWLIKNAVQTGSFLGVCGDARYAPDFATGQAAQAFLDLYDITSDERYKEAAIACAKIYTTSIYTHPVASKQLKTVNGVQREDWEISQAGLSFEHGGIFGSANRHGPIMLASHAGLFIRIYELTKDPLYLDMARSAAIGRDAFVDAKTSVSSYYWNAMNKGAGPYPHHAWWQIGWLTDYLLSEAQMRSGGRVNFPRGFVTPKVGPHQTYGFQAGKILNEEAELVSTQNILQCNQPNVEYLVAKSTVGDKLYILLLNNHVQVTQAVLNWGDQIKTYKKMVVKDSSGNTVKTQSIKESASLELDSFGLNILVFE